MIADEPLFLGFGPRRLSSVSLAGVGEADLMASWRVVMGERRSVRVFCYGRPL